MVKRSAIIRCPKKKVWKEISNIVGLSKWVDGVKKTIFLSPKKTGVGAIREIEFDDGNFVEEHVVGWKKEEYFSYIAVSGLPLRAYHATISLESLGKNKTRITWQSFFNSKKMSKSEFSKFVEFMNQFYSNSLKTLKKSLE